VAQGPLIDARAVAKVRQHIDDALSQGARCAPAASRMRWAAPSSSPPC
jgi:acyl-CoA reductase-like NAD-dependent aldehyde dehydrogenase